jgi:hypothetical protein
MISGNRSEIAGQQQAGPLTLILSLKDEGEEIPLSLAV